MGSVGVSPENKSLVRKGREREDDGESRVISRRMAVWYMAGGWG